MRQNWAYPSSPLGRNGLESTLPGAMFKNRSNHNPAGSGQIQIHPDRQARLLVVVVMGKGAVGVANVAAVPVGYSDAVTEFKLVLLVVKQASKSRDEL